jgi:diadenosine tetraphosphate (Ap4A) HIT family hydrolase
LTDRVFCESDDIRRRKITENDHDWAFPTNQPITPGHTLIVPKRCVATYEDLTDQERRSMDDLLFRLKPALAEAFDVEGFNYA